MVSPKKWASAVALTMLGVPSLALAQTAADAPAAPAATAAPTAAPAAEASASGSSTLSTGAGVSTTTEAAAPAVTEPAPAATTTAAPAAPAAPAAEPATDHEGVVGRWGVGLLGSTSLTTIDPNFNATDTALPIIGARYWFNDRLGLQAGFGIAHQSGGASQSNLATGVDTPTVWGLGVHVGVPYAFFYDKHYTLIAQPEANVVLGTGRQTDNQNVPLDQATQASAWGLDVGARIGAEVQFGFIGIPKLSLQGSVGLSYKLRQANLKTFEGTEEVNRTVTQHTLGTANNNDPWDLFTSSIAALYYF